MNIGENIRKLRKQNKLTSKQLGRMVRLSEQAICQYDRNERHPSITGLCNIANALNVSLDELVGYRDSEADNEGSVYTVSFNIRTNKERTDLQTLLKIANTLDLNIIAQGDEIK